MTHAFVMSTRKSGLLAWLTQPRSGVRSMAFLAFASLLLVAGCKTSDDAAAAASQMSATAEALSDYYTAAGTTLADTDQLFTLEANLLSKPYNTENQQLIRANETALAKRAALASDLSALASSFAKLTGSSAPADVSAAASRCADEISSLSARKQSSAEQNALKDAMQLLVKAVQEHKERESAKAIDQVAQDLFGFFAKEVPIWNSNEQIYIQQTTEVADYLAEHDAIDTSAFLKVALDPLGLTPSVASPELKAELAPLAKQQITARAAALNDAYARATGAMTASLQEMSQRIHLVAEDKPMVFRVPPVTIATVEQWAAHVANY